MSPEPNATDTADDDETVSVLNTLVSEHSYHDVSSKESRGTKPSPPTASSDLQQQLRPSFDKATLQDVLVSLLTDFVKPKLSAYKYNKLTAQGTRRIRPRQEDATRDESDPPSDVMTVLDWISARIEKGRVSTNFHVIIPPTLILLDSSHTTIRRRGLRVLLNLLDRMDETMLAKTGLAEVLWTTVLPNLSSLPPITEIDESAQVLKYTYAALIKLAKLWYPSLTKRVPLFDKVARDGVLFGMVFAGKNLKIAEVELQSLQLIIHEMGIHFVRHLKYVLPMLSSILADPLGTNHPPQLLLTLQVLEMIIQTCWPRIDAHHAEILRGITTCWRYLRNQESPDLMPIKTSLQRIANALAISSPSSKIDLQAISRIDSYYADLTSS